MEDNKAAMTVQPNSPMKQDFQSSPGGHQSSGIGHSMGREDSEGH